MKWVKASERKPDKDGQIYIRNKEERSIGYYEKELEDKESIFDEGDEWLDESSPSASGEELRNLKKEFEVQMILPLPNDYDIKLIREMRKAANWFYDNLAGFAAGKNDKP